MADFVPPSSSKGGSSISTGAVVGIVVAGLLVILLAVGILWWRCFQRKKNTLEQGKLQRNQYGCVNISDSFICDKKYLLCMLNFYIYIYTYHRHKSTFGMGVGCGFLPKSLSVFHFASFFHVVCGFWILVQK